MSVKLVDSERVELRMESGVGAGGQTAFDGLRKFQRFKPTILGAIEVAIGIVMTLTVIMYLAFGIEFQIIVLFWGIIVYIPAGAMAIATDKKVTKAMVWGTLVTNVLAALSAVAGCPFHFLAFLLFGYPPCGSFCKFAIFEILMVALSIVVFIVSVLLVAFAVAALCSSRKESTRK